MKRTLLYGLFCLLLLYVTAQNPIQQFWMFNSSYCKDFTLPVGQNYTNAANVFTIGRLLGTSGTLTLPSNQKLQIGCGNATCTTPIVLAGTGTFEKIGTGTVTTTAENTYTGITTISGGTLQIGDCVTGSLGGGTYTKAITNNGILIINTPINQTLSGIISGTGSFTKSCTGTTTLLGNNTYTGQTYVTGGILNLGHANALGSTSKINFNGGILQYSSANNVDYSAKINTAGNQNIKIDLNGQGITYASNISGTGTSMTVMDGNSTLPTITPGTVSALPNYGPISGGVATTITYPDHSKSFIGITTTRSTNLNFYGLSDDGWVYGWVNSAAANNTGALGTGNTTAYYVPTPMVRGEIPVGVTITKMAAVGIGGLVMIGSDGWVYATGNYNGLGNGTGTNSLSPVAIAQGEIPAGVKITQVDTDLNSVIALGDNGWVYTWGSNSNGQLGTGNTTNSLTPKAILRGAIPVGVKAVAVAIGSTGHLVADNKKIYSWGTNVNGALGNGGTTNSYTPVQTLQGQIPTTATPIFIQTNNSTVSVLCDNGWVYSWGRDSGGNYSLLGLGSTTTPVTSPKAIAQGDIPVGVTISKLSVGSNHSHIITSNGKLYGWGINNSGQFGTGSTDLTTKSPKASIQGSIPAFVTPIEVVSGTSYTMVLGDDGKIYKAGNGAPGATNYFALTANYSVSATFDGVDAPNIVDLNKTSSFVSPPAHALGKVDIVVTYGLFQNKTVVSTYATESSTEAYVYVPSITLSGANSFTGGTNINGNAVVVSSSTTATGNGDITINNGGHLFLKTNNTSAGTITVNPGGTLNKGNNTFSGTIVNNGGTVNP